MELSEHWTCGNCNAINIGDVFYGECWQCQISWKEENPKPDKVQVCDECKSIRGFHSFSCSLFKQFCEYCGTCDEAKHSIWCDRPKNKAPEELPPSTN